MEELLRSNDPVFLSYIDALLSEAEIEFVIMDQNMSVMEGSLGVLPRRILVHKDDWRRACALLDSEGVKYGPGM